MKKLTVVFVVFITLTAIPVAAAVDTATAWIEEGDTLVKTGRYYTAIHAYSKAIEQNPEDAKAYYKRASCYRSLSFRVAEKQTLFLIDVNQAIALNPKYADAYIIKGEHFQGKKDHARAFSNYNKAIEADPGYNQAYIARGRAYLMAGQISEAADDFNQAIDIDPSDPKGYLARGWANGRLKNNRQALDDYNMAVELDPDSAETYYARGQFFFQTLSDNGKALADLNRVIEFDPQSKSAYQLRADVFEKLEDYQACVSDFTRLIELEPQEILWYSERARGYFSLKQYDQAFEDLGKAIELDPENDRTYSNRAGFYTRINKYEEAMADYTKAIELNPDDKFHYFSRGKSAEKTGDFCQALNDYTKTIELDPQDHYSYGQRAEINMKIGNYQEAVEDFTRVLEIKKNSRQIYMTYRKRYKAYEKLAKYDLAVEDLRSAARLGDLMSKDKLKKIGILSPTVASPQTADDWNDLATNFLDSKKYTEAVQAYTSAIEFDPEKPFYYSGRAYAYILLQQDQRAIDDLTTAIEAGTSGQSKIDPSSISRWYSWRARAYTGTEKYREAAEDYSKQLELTKHPSSSLYHRRASSYEKAGMMEEAIEDLQIAARLGNKYAKARLRKETIPW